jgi:hypothetical protein
VTLLAHSFLPNASAGGVVMLLSIFAALRMSIWEA